MSLVSPLSITAYSVCNALGGDRSTVLQALFEGRSGLGAAPFDLPFATVVGRVQETLPDLPIPLASWTTRQARIAAHLVTRLEPGLARARERWRPHRIGVILGTSTAGADATEQAYRHFVEHGSFPDDYDFKRQHTYGALLHVVKELSGARGPGWVVSTTCTSSAKPLASAMRLIAADIVDAAIVGGVDTLCAMTLTGFHSLGALSDRPCQPFSRERKGISIGEGGAFLVVERSGDARVLLEGVGESSDAYHISAPHPEGQGARMAMERALAQAGCTPEAIDAINAHGTGTTLNDLAEGKAISSLFGRPIPVVSTKGYTGHTLGGAGAIEAVFAALAIEEGWLPASLGAGPLDPKIPIHVPTQVTQGTYRRVLSNSFAFGGSNVSVVVRAS